jgi:SAM-dependent methyltransferase
VYRVAGALLALAAIGLAYEVLLTRLFSLIFQYHYVFLIVSLAVLGLGIGAGIGHATRRYLTLARLAGGALAAAALLIVAAVVFARLPSANLTGLAAGVALLPFMALGWVNAGLFARYARHSAVLYGADLFGAVLGLLAALGLVQAVGAFDGVLVLGSVAALAALTLAGRRARSLLALAVVLILAGPLLARLGVAAYDPADLDDAPPDKTMIHVLRNPDAGARLMETRWSPFARVDLVQIADEALHYVFSDAGAGSVMVRYDPQQPDEAAWLRDNVDYFPFLAAETPERVLILGAGAGKDVVQARLAGAAQIEAVEINPAMVALTNDYAGYTGDVFRLPGVQVTVTDGRNYVERTGQRYDLIYLNLVYSQAATPGAAALVENYIFTREALTAYWEHLTDDGRLGFVTHTGPEGIRLFIGVLDMLQRQGYSLREALDRVTLVARRTDDPQTRVTVVTVFRQPVSADAAATLKQMITSRGNLSILYLPHVAEDLLGGLATGQVTLAQYIAGNPEFNYQPTTDDRPFFYHLQPGLPSVLVTLLRAVLILALFYLAFVFVAWDARRDSIARRSLWVGYFGLIGVAFMLVEIPMIQRFNLLLGAPALALIAVIGGMLLGGSAGSLFSGRFQERQLPRVIALATLVAGIAVGASAFVYPALIRWALPWALGLRVAFSLALLVPVGFVMGMAFPGGMRLVNRLDPNGIPVHWGANAVASTIGTTLATVIAMTEGFRLALLIGAGLYLAVAVLIFVAGGRFSAQLERR